MLKIQGFSHPEKVFTTANARKQDSDNAASSLYVGESRARSTGYSTTFLSFALIQSVARLFALRLALDHADTDVALGGDTGDRLDLLAL